MPRDARGFTLFEVMAAVALLGFVYTALATSSMQGLVAEGRARVQLDASLAADEVLAGIEAQAAVFGPPPEPREEETDHFIVRVVGPLPHPLLGETEDLSVQGFRIEIWDLEDKRLLAQRSTWSLNLEEMAEELEAVGGGTPGAGARDGDEVDQDDDDLSTQSNPNGLLNNSRTAN